MKILDGEFGEAERLAERALVSRPRYPRANVCKAHALMFLGQVDEARTLYENCSQERVDVDHTGEDTISNDLAQMRQAGLKHPLMDEIEAKLARHSIQRATTPWR
jgi:hypothetical protein